MKDHPIASVISRLAFLAPVLAVFAVGMMLRASSSGAESPLSSESAASASRKLDRILNPPSSSGQPPTTRFTEQEVNSYIHYDLASEYPPGISRVVLSFVPGSISGSADVDFDQLKSARGGAGQPGGQGLGQGLGMLAYLLRGVHTIACEGAFSSSRGIGRFNLGTVSIDGIALPRPLVDFLIESYLKPKFPTLNLDQPFRLPDSVDAIQVEQGTVDVKTRAATVDR